MKKKYTKPTCEGQVLKIESLLHQATVTIHTFNVPESLGKDIQLEDVGLNNDASGTVQFAKKSDWDF